MFEGQRLQYVVPGYTGHIPKKVYDEFQPLQQQQPQGRIPGYAGYMKGVKPENLYGETYGKTTLCVNKNEFIKGQDLDSRHKYASSNTNSFIAPSQRLQKTAADIVGVPNKQIIVKQPKIEHYGQQTDQFTLTKNEDFKKTMTRDNKWVDNKVVTKEGKDYVQLGGNIPGYTGFGKRITSNNLFGKTFAECRAESKKDSDFLQHEKAKNFNQQLEKEPPLKF